MNQTARTDSAAAALIEALRAEAAERIAAIEARGEQQLRELAREHAARAEALARSLEASAQEQLDREVRRLENRAALDAQKLRLRVVEDFTADMIRAAVARLRDERSDDYRRLLIRSAAAACAEISGGAAIIGLRPVDLAQHGTALRQAVAGAIELAADSSISLGGCIIEDRQTGVQYVATIEQALARLGGRIRHEALRRIRAAGHDRFPGASDMKGLPHERP